MNIQYNLGYHQMLDHAWDGVGTNRQGGIQVIVSMRGGTHGI